MLRFCLLTNCASCAGFGLLFLISPSASAGFIGTPPVSVVSLTGGILTLNAFLLALTAWRWPESRALIAFFVIGDIGWVLATGVLLGLGIWIEGTMAIMASVMVALMVAALGYGQFRFGLQTPAGDHRPA